MCAKKSVVFPEDIIFGRHSYNFDDIFVRSDLRPDQHTCLECSLQSNSSDNILPRLSYFFNVFALLTAWLACFSMTPSAPKKYREIGQKKGNFRCVGGWRYTGCAVETDVGAGTRAMGCSSRRTVNIVHLFARVHTVENRQWNRIILFYRFSFSCVLFRSVNCHLIGRFREFCQFLVTG